jgi:hypothetical protein
VAAFLSKTAEPRPTHLFAKWLASHVEIAVPTPDPPGLEGTVVLSGF